MPRDSQRQKIYDSEGVLPSQSADVSVAEMQAFVNKVCGSALVQERWPSAKNPPRVTDGRGRSSSACYAPEDHTVRIPRHMRSRAVILHEVAHALTYDEKTPWHGWEFAECFLYLVRVYMGRGHEESLRSQYKIRKVKYKPPRKSRMTDEQKAAAAERLAAARAKRKTTT